VIAHVGGLPVEETIAQLAPAGVALLVALRVTRETVLNRWRRGTKP
jgi:hypothetical protein